MKKNKVAALLGLLGVFLSSGLKSSGMENNNLGNPNGGNNSSFFSKILDYWPFPLVLTVGGGLKKMFGYNPKYKQNYYIRTPGGTLLNLTSGDQNWIDRNALLLDQKEGSSYCWHNASMNYILAPEFRNMTGLPEKIKIMTDWGNEQLEKESDRTNDFSQRLSGAVEVPRNIRQLPDGFENWLDGSDNVDINRGKPFMFNNASGMGSHTGGKEITFDGVNIRDVFTNIKSGKYSDVSMVSDEDELTILTNRVEDLKKGFTFCFMNPKVDLEQYGKDVLWFKPQDYFPTCVAVNQFGSGHYVVFYFVYDENKNVKFCICFDGNDGNYKGGNKSIKLLTYNEAIKKIKTLTIPPHKAGVGPMGGVLQGAYHVRYSTRDIVEEHYTSKD